MRDKAPAFAVLMMVLVTSGCVNTAVLGGNRPEDLAKSLPEVQNFLSSHPDSELTVSYISDGHIRSNISKMTYRCGPYFKITNYWKIEFNDPFSPATLTVWLEKDTSQLACLYGEGVDSPPPVIPEPPEQEIMVTGFSRIEVSDKLTDFVDGKLYLRLGNPNPSRITIKRVTANYLDDAIQNTTNSGILSQGDSFTYVLDFSRTADETFWIEADILYDMHDAGHINQRSRGSLISGMDISNIIQCSKASFEVNKYNFYVGTRIFSVGLENTGDIDLTIKTYYRNTDDELEEPAEPFDLAYGESGTMELKGLTRLIQSVILISDACPGAYQVIPVNDVAGL